MAERREPRELNIFRREAAAFIATEKTAGRTCPAYGAIVPPYLVEQSLQWQATVAAAGWAGIHWPAQFGGQGLSRDHTAVWFEECARARVAPYANLQGLVLAAEAIMRSGTDAQKETYLKPTLAGEILWCQLFSEPDAGSDLAGLSTAAVRDGDRYLINGQKVWSSNAKEAQFGILLARTDPEAAPHRGISFFLLDMNLPGVDARPLRQMSGEAEFCEVFLDNVEVPVDAVLGPENEGWRVAMEVLMDERGSFATAGVIGLEHRLNDIAAAATGGSASGGSGSEPSAAATDELAQLLARGHALKSLLQRSGGDVNLAPAAKLMRTEVDFAATSLMAQCQGAHAMLEGEQTSRFLYAPGMRIAGGSSEIQRNIIGERVLGLPREPRP